MNYEEDIKIDPDSLDIEWLEQPRLMLQYARHEAEMEQSMINAKEELDAIRAQLDLDIRSSPEDFDLPKITETAITNTILLQDEYKDAQKKYNNSRYEYEMSRNAVRAFQQRKDALENLVRLHGQQYFAGPKVPRNISKEWEQKHRQKKVDSGVAKKMKRSRS